MVQTLKAVFPCTGDRLRGKKKKREKPQQKNEQARQKDRSPVRRSQLKRTRDWLSLLSSRPASPVLGYFGAENIRGSGNTLTPSVRLLALPHTLSTSPASHKLGEHIPLSRVYQS